MSREAGMPISSFRSMLSLLLKALLDGASTTWVKVYNRPGARNQPFCNLIAIIKDAINMLGRTLFRRVCN